MRVVTAPHVLMKFFQNSPDALQMINFTAELLLSFNDDTAESKQTHIYEAEYDHH